MPELIILLAVSAVWVVPLAVAVWVVVTLSRLRTDQQTMKTTLESTVDYAYVLREVDGSARAVHDRHEEGLFPRPAWLRILSEAGSSRRSYPSTTRSSTPAPSCSWPASQPRSATFLAR